MKISAFTVAFAISAPFVSAAGFLKGARKLQQRADVIRIDLGDNPTLDQIEDAIDGFCDLCCIGDILGQDDMQFCGLCPDDACDQIAGIDVPDVPTCFSEKSTVQVQGMGSVSMKDLKIGARVLTSSGLYEPVYAFGHKNPVKEAEFLQLKTSESILEMTGAHLVFLADKTNPARADSVKVGDVLRSGESGVKVQKIISVKRKGIYSPLTPGGTVVVDGIVASTYLSLQKGSSEHVQMQGGINTFSYQDFLHMALSPFRMFAMGISSKLANVYTDDGIPIYASRAMDFAQWANNQNILIQAVLMVAFVLIAGAFMLVENTFGPSMAPLAIVACTGAYAIMKKNSLGFRVNKIKSV